MAGIVPDTSLIASNFWRGMMVTGCCSAMNESSAGVNVDCKDWGNAIHYFVISRPCSSIARCRVYELFEPELSYL